MTEADLKEAVRIAPLVLVMNDETVEPDAPISDDVHQLCSAMTRDCDEQSRVEVLLARAVLAMYPIVAALERDYSAPSSYEAQRTRAAAVADALDAMRSKP